MILLALYLCVYLFAFATRRSLYDSMNRMSDWPDQFLRAFATVFSQAVWHMILSCLTFLFSFPFLPNMCTFYFADNML
jgi:hypothetical protein